MPLAPLANQIAELQSSVPAISTNPYLTLARKRLEEARRLVPIDDRRAAFFLDEAIALKHYADEFETIQKRRPKSA